MSGPPPIALFRLVLEDDDFLAAILVLHLRLDRRSVNQGRTDPGRPEVCNVCQMHRFFSPDDYETIWDGERTARTGCVDTKRLLADRMLGFFEEARERRRELEARPGYVEEVLQAGATRLARVAAETMRICHEVTGLGPR